MEVHYKCDCQEAISQALPDEQYDVIATLKYGKWMSLFEMAPILDLDWLGTCTGLVLMWNTIVMITPFILWYGKGKGFERVCVGPPPPHTLCLF